jgi:hypothetical protein
MPPEAAGWLQELQAEGLLGLRQHAELVTAEWDWQAGQWDVYLEVGAYNLFFLPFFWWVLTLGFVFSCAICT